MRERQRDRKREVDGGGVGGGVREGQCTRKRWTYSTPGELQVGGVGMKTRRRRWR